MLDEKLSPYQDYLELLKEFFNGLCDTNHYETIYYKQYVLESEQRFTTLQTTRGLRE